MKIIRNTRIYAVSYTHLDVYKRQEKDGFTLLAGSKQGNVSINAEGKSASDWENFLRENLNISLSGSGAIKKLRFSASAKKADNIYDYNADNGHYYLAVNNPVAWTTARDNASAATYMGMKGYLATITSEEENDYLYSMIQMNTWIGGCLLYTSRCV